MILVTVLTTEFHAENISLFLSLIQTVVAIISFMDFEEVLFMVNRIMAGCGIHGVVLFCLETNIVTGAQQVQSLPAPPYMRLPFGVVSFFVPPVTIQSRYLRVT